MLLNIRLNIFEIEKLSINLESEKIFINFQANLYKEIAA